MTHDMTHERCSELLAPYLDRDLGDDEAAAVGAHLSGCDQCSRERAALEALSSPGDAPLSEHERARLHRALQSATTNTGATGARGGRWVAALGAAALIVLVGVALTQIGGGGGGDASTGAVSRPITNQHGEAAGAPQRALDATKEQEGAAAPRYGPALGKVTTRSLKRLARRSHAFAAYSTAYRLNDIARLTRPFVTALAAEARTSRDRAQLRRCATVVVDENPSRALPVYAARARFDAQRALVLGFVTPNGREGRLDRFLFWVWPLGSCDVPLESQSGPIAPRR